MILNLVIYLLAGFIQEGFITSYHRAVIAERNILASVLASVITLVSLVVITGIIKQIMDPLVGNVSILYALTFATGKGCGAYTSLSWWSKRDSTCNGAGDCQRRI